MTIVITGSLGNISKPLTQLLAGEGHALTVISSDPGKKSAIEELGAASAIGIAKNMEQEYYTNIDRFSQNLIIAQLELLLTYVERFYQRQFITCKIANHEILTRLEDFLSDYFNSGNLAKQGLPAVTHIAETLNISPGYLSSLLKSLTGQSTQQHLHDKLIELAKEKLSTTNLSVSKIAY